jgi:hypothetical protein
VLALGGVGRQYADLCELLSASDISDILASTFKKFLLDCRFSHLGDTPNLDFAKK